MTLKIVIRNILILLITVAGVLSCAGESLHEIDRNPNSGNALVKLEVRVPGNTVPKQRILQPQQEDEVAGIVVFAFNKGTDDNQNTRLRHVGKSIGEPQGTGTTKQFTVELYSGEWDLWVLANAESLLDGLETVYGAVDIYSDDFIGLEITKSNLQAALKETVIGKWNVDPNDPSGRYRIPMWGMLDAVQVQTSSTNIIKTVNLYRMLARVDVEIQRNADEDAPDLYPGIPLSQFELTHVSLHNYNTTGRLVPGLTPEDGDWTNPNGGVALKASLPDTPGTVCGWEENKRLEWSTPDDFAIDGTALNGMIYTFEAEAGTQSNDRPCIIIGGRFGESSRVTYYRADFLNTSKKYLSVLRNHKYKFLIRKIGGPGFPTIEDAYIAGPTNLEAEVIEWNEGEYLEGVWNETYEIRFSDVKAHFTQFGKPDQQVIKIRTNVPELKFEEFTDFTSEEEDTGFWEETSANLWTNGHFRVEVTRLATVGGYTDYEIAITSETAKPGDGLRFSTFMVKGYMLKVKVTVSQDGYFEYKLQTLPDHTRPIAIDGTAQLLRIDITSTHDYKIELRDRTMFPNVYTDAAGTQPISDLNNIPKSTTTVYISVAQYRSDTPRVGEFFISHVLGTSTAQKRIYSVLQLSPILLAELEEGGYTTQVHRRGTKRTINVSSNLAGWKPLLNINGMAYNGDLSQYFSVVNGSQNQKVVFTIPEMAASETSDKVYTILFKDNNSSLISEYPIIITQKSMSTTPPITGVKAPAYILAVNSKGELNLDGDGYIVYFKWGSLIALSGSPNPFNSLQIAWAPDEFDTNAVGNDWLQVPYATTKDFPATNPTAGLGDPCEYALRNGVKGGWKTPSGPLWFEHFKQGGWDTVEIQGTHVRGAWNQGSTMFYPAAGRRVSGNALEDVGTYGYYWMRSSPELTTGNAMAFSSTYYTTGLSRGRAIAFPIRCIQ